jgi:hypothetical protein
LLPADAYDFDFEDGGDGSLCERFAAYLREEASITPLMSHARFAHWLHECIIDTKLDAYPFHLMLYLQTQNAVNDILKPSLLRNGPAALACSATTMDQLLTLEQFYHDVRHRIGASHLPLISEDFLVERCTVVRDASATSGPLTTEIQAALRFLYKNAGRSCAQGQSDHVTKTAIAAVYTRLHGLPGHISSLGNLPDTAAGRVEIKCMLPRLRRQFPGASAAGLQTLFAALTAAGA